MLVIGILTENFGAKIISANKLSINFFFNLGFGIWDLGFGIWYLGLGIQDLGFGIQDLGLGIWNLDSS